MNSSILHTKGWVSHFKTFTSQGPGEDAALRHRCKSSCYKSNHNSSKGIGPSPLSKQRRKLTNSSSCNCTGTQRPEPRLSQRPSLDKGRRVSEDTEDEQVDPTPLREGITDFLKKIAAIGAPIGVNGYETGDSLYNYFGAMLAKTPIGSRVPIKQARILYELLKQGHALADEKIGVGIKYIYAGRHKDYGQKCFMIMRKDNTTIDFSYRKCLQHIITNEWQNSPPKIIALMNTSRRLYTSKEFKPRGEMNELTMHAQSTIYSILNLIQHWRDCPAFTLLAATRGLGFCVLVNEEVLMPMLECHESFQLLLNAVEHAALGLPIFYSVLQFSSIERFASNTAFCGEACSRLTKRIIEAADLLHPADYITLLKSASRRPSLYTSMMPILESLSRKLREEEFPLTTKLINHLTECIFAMQLSPNDFFRGMNISFIHTEANDSANSACILNRFMLNKCYPGPNLMNKLIVHALISMDATLWSLLVAWNAVIIFRHKLSPQHMSLIADGLSKSQDSLHLRELSTWIWGFGYLGLDPPVFYECIETYAKRVAESYDMVDCQEIPLCLWSMAVFKKYEMPEFGLLWSTVNRAPPEQFSELSLASLYQVNGALKLECPHLSLEMPTQFRAAASAAWQRVRQRVGVSRPQLDVSQTCQKMGIRACQKYSVSPDVLPLDIALLSPNYEASTDANSDTSLNTWRVEADSQDMPLHAAPDPTVLDVEESMQHPMQSSRENGDGNEHQDDPLIFYIPEFAIPDSVKNEHDNPGEALYKALHVEPPTYDGSSWYENNLIQTRLENIYRDTIASWLGCSTDVLDMFSMKQMEDTDNSLAADTADVPNSSAVSLPKNGSDSLESVHVAVDGEDKGKDTDWPFSPSVVAIEVDGPSRYFVNSTDLLGQQMFSSRLMQKLGCKVVRINAGEWSKLSESGKKEHLHKLLDGVGIDSFQVTHESQEDA